MLINNKLCYCFLFLLLIGCNKDIEFGEGSSNYNSNFSLILVSGNNQVGLQNTTLLDNIIVRVEDETGVIASGVSLNAQVVSGGGQVISTQIITNENGIANISWKLGDLYNNTLKIFPSLDEVSSIFIDAQAKYKYNLPEVVNDGLSVIPLPEITDNFNSLYDGMDEIRQGNISEIHSMVVSIDDNVVFEEYFQGTNSGGQFINYTRDIAHELQSVNKSYRGIMTGIAIDKGFIDSDQVPISSFYPELSYLSSGGKEDILLEHFLTMSSGLEWDESSDLTGFYGTPWETAHTYVLSKPLDHSPGTNFEYHTGTSVILNKLIINSINTDYALFAQTNYSDLIESNWLPGTGEPLDFRNTPRDMLKLGIIYLNNGKWKDTQIVSESWVEKSTTAHFNVNSTESYGYQWWIRQFTTNNNSYDCFYALGYGGQFIFVVKELNLVAVFTGGNFNSDMFLPYSIMEQYILPAFE